MLKLLIVSSCAFADASRVHTSARSLSRARVVLSDVEVPIVEAPVKKAAAVVQGANDAGLKTITLTNQATGDSATMFTFGACVTSYIAGGVETLKVRPDAKLDGSKPISGGIPHCFPQFGPGAIQQHGFARNLEWEVMATSPSPVPSVSLRLADTDATRAMWPHSFEAIYTVTLANDRLQTSFKVKNTGKAAFAFTAALHSYFDISAVSNLKIQGNFKGAQYLDKMTNPPSELVAQSDEITISKEVDQVYKGVSGEVRLVDSGKGTSLAIQSKMGWRDTVLWNPYGNEGMGYNSFVCAEAALAAFPFTLQPGVEWTGQMDLVCSKL